MNDALSHVVGPVIGEVQKCSRCGINLNGQYEVGSIVIISNGNLPEYVPELCKKRIKVKV